MSAAKPALNPNTPDPRIEIKEASQVRREAIEDAEEFTDVLAVLENPGKPISMAEIREKYSL